MHFGVGYQEGVVEQMGGLVSRSGRHNRSSESRGRINSCNTPKSPPLVEQPRTVRATSFEDERFLSTKLEERIYPPPQDRKPCSTEIERRCTVAPHAANIGGASTRIGTRTTLLFSTAHTQIPTRADTQFPHFKRQIYISRLLTTYQ